MSYLLPYDSVYSLWLMAAPIYEWEPLAPAEGESAKVRIWTKMLC